MRFLDDEHKAFYEQMVTSTRTADDPYRKALFYTLGLTENTRRNIDALYDFSEHCPRFDAIRGSWQTSTSAKVTRLAFYLYGGYDGKGKTDQHDSYTPYELFGCGLMEYLFEAVRLLYPCYTDAAQGGITGIEKNIERDEDHSRKTYRYHESTIQDENSKFIIQHLSMALKEADSEIYGVFPSKGKRAAVIVYKGENTIFIPVKDYSPLQMIGEVVNRCLHEQGRVV